MTTASLARTRRVDGTSALGPQPPQALLAASPHVRCDVPEQELRRFPLPACTALSRLFADGLVSKSVSIRSRGLGGVPLMVKAVDAGSQDGILGGGMRGWSTISCSSRDG